MQLTLVKYFEIICIFFFLVKQKIYYAVFPTFKRFRRYRFLELNYHRAEENHKGRVHPGACRNCRYFSCPTCGTFLPTKVEWENVVELYKKTLSRKLAAIDSRDKKPEGRAAATTAGTPGFFILYLEILFYFFSHVACHTHTQHMQIPHPTNMTNTGIPHR